MFSNISLGSTWSYDHQSTLNFSPPLERTVSGTSSASNPFIYYQSYEFTSAEVSTYNLPGLNDRIACYMHPDPRVQGYLLRDSVDITNNSGIFTLVSSPFVPAPAGDDLGNQPISRAVGFNGLVIFLTIIGVISSNF